MSKHLLAVSMISALFGPISAFGASAATCRNYARYAVEDYKLTTTAGKKKCQIKSDARWHADYNAHYKWCLSAPVEWIRSEEKARNTHLMNCGARATY